MAICTKADITELERQYGVRLPSAYRAFLLGSHPNVNAHLIGADIDMHYLPKLKNWAKELISENNVSFTFSENHFVFLMHQGYYFMFFACDGSNNPPVFSYFEGQPAPALEFDSFSDWISQCEKENIESKGIS